MASQPHGCVRGVIAIPARLASSRLPNKLLLSETGKPLLAHVIEQARKAVQNSRGLFTEVVVACDHPNLLTVAQQCGVRGVMTSSSHRCGTTRIAEALDLLQGSKLGQETVLTSGDVRRFDFVVNVQGDEPEISPAAIGTVAETLLEDPTADMATLAIAIPPGDLALKADPNAVKVVFNGNGHAMFFSRSPIPFDRNPPESDEPIAHHHLGIYAYRRRFLAEFARMPASRLETRESLEQLRALEAGRTIRVRVVPAAWAGKGIDTAADYAAFVCRHAA